MSLILRKQAQNLLANTGLDSYHCSINSDKNLSIVSECGKPFLSIKGIQFSKKIPILKEIEIAIELLDKFLRTNSILISNILLAKANLVSMPILDIATSINIENTTISYTLYSFKDYSINFNYVAKTYAIKPPYRKYLSLNKNTFSLLSDKSIEKELIKYGLEYDKFSDRLKTYNDLLSILNKCDI